MIVWFLRGTTFIIIVKDKQLNYFSQVIRVMSNSFQNYKSYISGWKTYSKWLYKFLIQKTKKKQMFFQSLSTNQPDAFELRKMLSTVLCQVTSSLNFSNQVFLNLIQEWKELVEKGFSVCLVFWLSKIDIFFLCSF